MSYFAQGINNGAQIGAQAYRDAQKKKEDELDRQLRRELLEKQLDADVAKMRETFGFQSGEADKGRTFSREERLGTQTWQNDRDATDRSFRRTERLSTQDFQGAESQLERDARLEALDRQLRQQKVLADAEQTFKQSQFDWEKDPANPGNQSRSAYAKRLLSDLPDAPDSAGNPPAFSKDDEGRVVIGPDGKRYIIRNGQPVLQ